MGRVSQKTGSKVEKILKDFLGDLSFSNFGILPKDMRLMKSGNQYGLDLSWSVSFRQEGVPFRWFFEAKGHGYGKYKRTRRGVSFSLSLISDKLLQVLASWENDIDCWCLFIPYARLDARDHRELDKLQTIFPFRIIVWDKSFCDTRLKIFKGLYQSLYSKSTIQRIDPIKVDILKNDLLADLKQAALYGQFLREIHKKYTCIRADIERVCRKEIFFTKESKSENKEGYTYETSRYYFQSGRLRFYINKQYLDEVICSVIDPPSVPRDMLNPIMMTPPIREVNAKVFESEGLLKILKNSIGPRRESLFIHLKKLISLEEVPFFHISMKHKFSDYSNLSFLKLNSSIYFECDLEKPIIFVHVKDFL